jgi:hypothetical protein
MASVPASVPLTGPFRADDPSSLSFDAASRCALAERGRAGLPEATGDGEPQGGGEGSHTHVLREAERWAGVKVFETRIANLHEPVRVVGQGPGGLRLRLRPGLRLGGGTGLGRGRLACSGAQVLGFDQSLVTFCYRVAARREKGGPTRSRLNLTNHHYNEPRRK